VTPARTTPPAARTVTVTVSPAAPEPLCRTLFPNSTHLRKIYAKLGTNDRSEAVKRARGLRLLTATRMR
jgi:hypothetical protein